MWMEISFVFFLIFIEESGDRFWSVHFWSVYSCSLRIKLGTVIGTESNVSVGSLRDLSEFHVSFSDYISLGLGTPT